VQVNRAALGPADGEMGNASQKEERATEVDEAAGPRSQLLSLPDEVLIETMRRLQFVDLVALYQTKCKRLRYFCCHPLVLKNLPIIMARTSKFHRNSIGYLKACRAIISRIPTNLFVFAFNYTHEEVVKFASSLPESSEKVILCSIYVSRTDESIPFNVDMRTVFPNLRCSYTRFIEEQTNIIQTNYARNENLVDYLVRMSDNKCEVIYDSLEFSREKARENYFSYPGYIGSKWKGPPLLKYSIFHESVRSPGKIGNESLLSYFEPNQTTINTSGVDGGVPTKRSGCNSRTKKIFRRISCICGKID